MATHVPGSPWSARSVVLALVAAGGMALAGCSNNDAGHDEARPSAESPAISADPGETTDPEPARALDDAAVEEPGQGDAESSAPSSTATADVETPWAGWEQIELPVTGPTVPGTDLSGAKAAAEGIFASYLGGLVSGNSQNVRALSGENCDQCKAYIAEIENRAARGERLAEKPTWSYSEMLAGHPNNSPNGAHLVLIKYTVQPLTFVDSSGEITDSVDQEEGQAGILVRLTDRGWVVDKITGESDENYEQLVKFTEG